MATFSQVGWMEITPTRIFRRELAALQSLIDQTLPLYLNVE
jgi:hypothetical protein